MRKSLITVMMASWAIITLHGQTANNDAVKVSWALTTGNLETGVCSPESQSQFITPGAMAIGSGITITAESSSDKTGTTSDGYTQTFFKASKSGDNAVTFSITPKTGITFTPTKVGLKAARWKTDKGSISVVWVNGDGTTKSLGSFTPKREASDPTCSIEEYTMDGSIASDKTCQLVVTISGMDGKKTISMGDVFIEGTTYGTVGQAITHSLTTTASPAEGGNVSVSPAGTTFERGTSVTLSQTPNEGWVFTGWYNNGALLSTSPSYTFNIMGNMDIEAKYQSEASLLVSDYIIVSNKDEFRAAIKQVNQNTTGKRQFIFLKNGDYDYGTFHNYENDKNTYDPSLRDTIKVDNVSIIGQQATHISHNPAPATGDTEKGVRIHILPDKEGISITSPLVNRGNGTYLQDFTIENDYQYSGTARACVWQDEGHHTIGKNMCLLSYQDTYYPHAADGQFYWETSDIRGVVDFICGNGDVFLNKCRLVNRDRSPYNTTAHEGGATLTAPYTQVEDFNLPGGHGFIINECTIDCESQTWDFGRGWRGWPKLAIINTTLTEQAALRIGADQTKGKAYDKTLRVDKKSIQTSSDSHYLQFYEYNTMDEFGNVNSPESNVLTFTASDSKTYETILSAGEADRFQLRNVYPDWQPDEECRQVVVTSCQLEGNTLSWTANDKAKAFLIENDGDFVAIVDGTQNSYTVSGSSTDAYTVRAANMMGGFGLPTTAGAISGIDVHQPQQPLQSRKVVLKGHLVIEKDGMRYNAMGQQIKH